MTCVVKGRDDPDVTHGIEILFTFIETNYLKYCEDPGIRALLTEGNVTVAAGRGVGQVTWPTKIPPGQPAVNPVLAMIRNIEDQPGDG